MADETSAFPQLPQMPQFPNVNEINIEPVQAIGVVVIGVIWGFTGVITALVSNFIHTPESAQQINQFFKGAPQIFPQGQDFPEVPEIEE